MEAAVQAFKTLADVPPRLRRPMKTEESRIFLHATMAQMAGGDEVLSGADFCSKVDAESAPAALRILVHRLALGDESLRFSFMTAATLAGLCNSPGRAVMWAHYLVQRSYELGGVVDNDVLARDFPMGFPTDEGAGEIWDAQKVNGNNGLDNIGAWRRAA